MKSEKMGAVIGGMKRTKRFSGCTFQRNAHGCGKFSVDIHCANTEENRKRFPSATVVGGSSLWVGTRDWEE